MASEWSEAPGWVKAPCAEADGVSSMEDIFATICTWQVSNSLLTLGVKLDLVELKELVFVQAGV